MDDVEVTEVTVPADAAVDVAIDASVVEASPETTSCEATKTDDACFDCCDAKFPTAVDVWSDAFDACCPDDACTDDEYEKCELAADDACANDASCSGLETCEAVCWEKPSSGR